MGVGTLKIFDEFNTLIATFTEADITIDGNTFGIDNSTFIKTLKKYYVIISDGLFKAQGCDTFGVSNINELPFEIGTNEFDPEDFDTTNDFT